MHCYECAKGQADRPAVAVCRSCSAGLCLEHVRQTAGRLNRGSLAPTCNHDTWSPARG